MKPEVKIQLLTFCLKVFNFIFLALGLSVAGFGLWILFGSGTLLTVNPSEELRTVGAGLSVIGGVVAAVSVVGCVAADGGNRFLLLTTLLGVGCSFIPYLGFLIVLVLGQLFVTLLLLINRDKIEQSLEDTVDQIILQYGGNSHSQDRLMDNVQHYEECCGRMGPADWLKNSYIQSLNLTDPDVLPCSCFSSYRPSGNSSWCLGQGNSSYEQGCKKKVRDWLHENALTIVGMDVGLMFIQVVQFVFTVYLYRAVGRKADLKRTELLAADYIHEDDLDSGEQNFGYIDPDDGSIDPAHPAHHPDYPNPGDRTHLAIDHDNQNYNRMNALTSRSH